MKYIEPPTKRRKQIVGPIPPKQPGENWIVRIIFFLIAMGIILILSGK